MVLTHAGPDYYSRPVFSLKFYVLESLTFLTIMLKNGQVYLKYAWPFFSIMHERVKFLFS